MTYELVPGCPICEHSEREAMDTMIEKAEEVRPRIGTIATEIARAFAPGGEFSGYDVLQHMRHMLPARGPDPHIAGIAGRRFEKSAPVGPMRPPD